MKRYPVVRRKSTMALDEYIEQEYHNIDHLVLIVWNHADHHSRHFLSKSICKAFRGQATSLPPLFGMTKFLRSIGGLTVTSKPHFFVQPIILFSILEPSKFFQRPITISSWTADCYASLDLYSGESLRIGEFMTEWNQPSSFSLCNAGFLFLVPSRFAAAS